MRSLFVAIYNKVFNIQLTHDISLNKTNEPKTKQGYKLVPQHEAHGLPCMESDHWHNESGISAVAYHVESDGDAASGRTDGKSDGDELQSDQQHLGIMKRTELTVSEHRI